MRTLFAPLQMPDEEEEEKKEKEPGAPPLLVMWRCRRFGRRSCCLATAHARCHHSALALLVGVGRRVSCRATCCLSVGALCWLPAVVYAPVAHFTVLKFCLTSLPSLAEKEDPDKPDEPKPDQPAPSGECSWGSGCDCARQQGAEALVGTAAGGGWHWSGGHRLSSGPRLLLVSWSMRSSWWALSLPGAEE